MENIVQLDQKEFLERYEKNVNCRLKNETGLAGLIIDMQEKFLSEIDETGKWNMIDAQKKIIKRLSEKNAPIIILEYRGYGGTIEELIQEIDFASNGISLIKGENDGFKGTKLHSILKRNHSHHLILMGVNATFCVKETAIGALIRKYQIYTARELIAGKKKYDGIEMNQKIRRWYSDKGEFFPREEQLWKFIEKEIIK